MLCMLPYIWNLLIVRRAAAHDSPLRSTHRVLSSDPVVTADQEYVHLLTAFNCQDHADWECITEEDRCVEACKDRLSALIVVSCCPVAHT